MTKPEILKKQPLTLAELKGMLSKLKKRDGELSFRAGKTEDYVNQVLRLNQKQSSELKKKIIELEIPRLKEEYVVKIVDLLPRSLAELKIVLQGYTITVSNDNLNKILAVINDVVPAKK